jgi:UDP-N-acetylglucosamine--N-acetylmuramyl-(pentapeptide) pyrophosphoryl-undecaprenol N-acetylglucosamine transferase
LLEKDLSGQKLVEEIDRILLDENQLKEMKKNAKELGIPDAAKRLYNVMKDLVEQR